MIGGLRAPGSGPRATLVNPATEVALAEVHTGGHDLRATLGYARAARTPELGGLSFAQRGALLAGLARAIHGAREKLIALAIANGGNTRREISGPC